MLERYFPIYGLILWSTINDKSFLVVFRRIARLFLVGELTLLFLVLG